MIKFLTSHKNYISISYLLLLIISFCVIYTAVFDEKVNLGGDNANYYILGNALAQGEGYVNIHHLEKEAHYHYPPGYPIIIAGISHIISNEIHIIKIANGFLFLGAILLLFFIIKELTGNVHVAFLTGLITLFNYHLLTYATIMMSEIPFLFVSLLSILLFLKIDFTKKVYKNRKFLLIILCVTFAFYIRSVALALVVALCIYLFLKKYWYYLFTLVTGFTLLYVPWFLRGQKAVGNTYISQLSLKNPYQPELGTVGIADIFERIVINFERYFTKEIPSSFAYLKEIKYISVESPISEWLIGFFIMAIILYGLMQLRKYKLFFAGYLLAFFALLLVWPSVWYGTRFLLPIVPLLVFLFINGLVTLFSKLNEKYFQKQRFVLPVTLFCLMMCWLFFYGNPSISKLKTQAETAYADNYKNFFAMAEWTRKHTDAHSVTAVRKEGLFYMFSKKYVTNFLKSPDREAQITHLKHKKVTHVVVEQLGYSSTSKYVVPAIDRYPNKFKTQLELKNPNTYLMQFLPDLGYTGAWENEQRNGFGTYVWEDGQKYIGQWKNDLRHGNGTVYFADGTQLSGIWNNGKLNGTAVKKSADGKLIEKAVYENNVKVTVVNEGT